MAYDSVSSGVVTHYKRLSWKARLAESRPMLIFFLSLLLFGALGGVILAPLICKYCLGGMGNWFPILFFGFIGGLAGSLVLVFAVRYIDRKFFGSVKASILAAEDRVISGNSKTQLQDLEKLVFGYLKLKRLEAADYYSKKLLELSKSGGTEIMKLTDWVVTSECWVSTQAYQRSWSYKLIWLFETRGILTLSPSKLDFQSKNISFCCTPANIASVELKRHPLWLKPIPFRYISLTIDEQGIRHIFNLTPSFGHTDTVFDCNRLVDVWYKRLQRMKNGVNQAGNFPDWLRDY